MKEHARSWRRLDIRLLISAMSAILVVASSPAVVASEDFGNVLSKADLNYSQGNYEEALKLYKRANSIDKNNYDCLWGMALTFNKLGKYNNALKISERLIKGGSGDAMRLAKAWNLRGNTLFEAAMNDSKGVNEKKLREAASAFREVLKIGPDLNVAHYNLGTALIRMRRMDEGLGELRAYLINAKEPGLAEKARLIVEAPGMPIPVVELVSSGKREFSDGYRDGYTLKIRNWADFSDKLFKVPKDFPPCQTGAPVNARLEVTVLGDQPPHFPPICSINKPESLQYIVVSSQLVYRRAASLVPKRKKLFVRIEDRLTGNVVMSNPVAVP